MRKRILAQLDHGPDLQDQVARILATPGAVAALSQLLPGSKLTLTVA